MTNATVILLHGANASSRCWNYISQSIVTDCTAIEYSSANSFFDNLSDIAKQITAIAGNLIFIGHSLGGIYAVHLANMFKSRTLAVASISTPYAGIEMVGIVKLLYPTAKLFKDIAPTSKPITDATDILKKLTAPALQIITTKGSAPWIPYPNDGVVSIKSQSATPNIQTSTLDTNHYEVLLHPETILILKNFFVKHKLQIIQ